MAKSPVLGTGQSLFESEARDQNREVIPAGVSLWYETPAVSLNQRAVTKERSNQTDPTVPGRKTHCRCTGGSRM